MAETRDKVAKRYQLMRQVLADNVSRALSNHPIFRGEEKALAAATGIGKSTINRITRAETNLTLDNMTDLAHALGLRPSALLEPFMAIPEPPRPREFRPEETDVLSSRITADLRPDPVLHSSRKIEDAAASRRARRHGLKLKKG